ncbi:activating transcription factor 7-interacting protein 2 isoform X2 [Cololabis saira]|uniref:activating transcription factor 7-interacting protein 2 isoform X2 n=1 Tax=Cololabis saira TaxID=129043 RepID=UPI002AD5440C|nr:activating transcription factor 7-interacting protein 2 isoform X2 [Cololabis saira]
MESHPTGTVSAEASSLKKTFSKSEVEKMIEQEVHKAVKNSETRMQGLVETVQELTRDENFEKSIQKLQARINLVSKRTEKALSYLKKMEEKSPLPQDHTDTVRGDLKDEKMKTMLQNEERMECETKSGELIKMVATTQNELKKICKDNEALTDAITDISHEEPPPILTPYGSPMHTKNNTRNHQGQEPTSRNHQDQEPTPRNHQDQEPTPRNHHEEKDQAESWITYPPLPPTTFPSVLSSTAVSYSIPQKLEVTLCLIKNPTRLSVLWNVTEKDPFTPPMESYTIFLTMEKAKGSGIFSDWHTYDKVEALALPMCALIKKYKPGHRVCAAVLGKDIFGRYGPYSDVVTRTIPE